MRAQDADHVLVDTTAESDDFAVAINTVVAHIANLERRRWYTRWSRSVRRTWQVPEQCDRSVPDELGCTRAQQTRAREEKNQPRSAVALVHVKLTSSTRRSL